MIGSGLIQIWAVLLTLSGSSATSLQGDKPVYIHWPLISTEASHSITLHCLNDPPDVPMDSFTSTQPIHKENTTLRFRGWNKQMFEKDTLLEPHVLQDECKIQDGSWHQSRFFFHTQDSRQLPIVDIQEFPTSQPNTLQHIEIGPVCFL
uniref:Fibrillar collagen NC1 domain-containing protein n=1 Tax=Lates calcarifer TaxID=8187 RepID=A0A4W6FP22_LATCA